MATTRRTKAAETAAETEAVVAETTAAPAVKEYSPTDIITCHSVTAGELLCHAQKSDTLYIGSGYGDIMQIQYQDLLSMKLGRSKYIYAPLFVIDDEELLSKKEWADVKAVYDDMYDADDINAFFKLSAADMKKTLKKAPSGFKNAIKTIAAEKIENGTFDAMTKIKAIDETLGTDFAHLI